jgi:hypothetical protein
LPRPLKVIAVGGPDWNDVNNAETIGIKTSIVIKMTGKVIKALPFANQFFVLFFIVIPP